MRWRLRISALALEDLCGTACSRLGWRARLADAPTTPRCARQARYGLLAGRCAICFRLFAGSLRPLCARLQWKWRCTALDRVAMSGIARTTFSRLLFQCRALLHLQLHTCFSLYPLQPSPPLLPIAPIFAYLPLVSRTCYSLPHPLTTPSPSQPHQHLQALQ